MNKVLLGVVVVAAIGLAVAMAMPSRWEVTQTVVLDSPPATVYGVLADLRRWPDWTEWNTRNDPDARLSYAGPATGAGSEMQWAGKRLGHGTVRITEATPFTSVKFEVRFEGHQPSSGTLRLSPADPQAPRTTVVWSMQGDAGLNPIARLSMPRVRDVIAEQLHDDLQQLATIIGRPGAPGPKTPAP